jgi:hypothetical protein
MGSREMLALRVAAAEAVWKVGERRDLALPFLAWALNDEYWGVSRNVAQVLIGMGPVGSRRGRHHGFSRYSVSPAAAAGELCRSAGGGRVNGVEEARQVAVRR